MKNQNRTYRDTFIVGFALFSMFFGAASIIFIGHEKKEQAYPMCRQAL